MSNRGMVVCNRARLKLADEVMSTVEHDLYEASKDLVKLDEERNIVPTERGGGSSVQTFDEHNKPSITKDHDNNR